ncbi:hypothetical protein E4T56_gene6313 [Termitomyces sp. T112]|nr:hypothetical protein E4T56_gene6313 [Termitomyces sp. T112]
MATFPKAPFVSQHITKAACADIKWWSSAMLGWNGICLIAPTRQTVDIFTDFIPSFEHATHVRLTLPASKTDPFWKGVTVIVAAAPGCSTCPVAALKALFSELPHDDDAPLFEQLNGRALSYNYFVNAICEALSLAGLNPGLYVGHSFRCGVTSAAATAGYSDYEIQLLSWWRSNSYKLYINNDPMRILHLSSLLHLAHTHLVPFEPPALCDFTAMA